MYVELVECDKCMTKHFVEVWRNSAGEWKQRCHGAELKLETDKTFAKHSGKGFKIYKIRGMKKEIGMPTNSKVLQDQDHLKNLQVDF